MEEPYWRKSTILVHTTHIYPHWWKVFHPLSVIVNQVTHYNKDIHYNIPSDWVVHDSTLGYMDCNGRHISMANFPSVCCYSPLNTKVILYYGHAINIDDRESNILWSHLIYYLILKETNYIYDHKIDMLCVTNETIAKMDLHIWDRWNWVTKTNKNKDKINNTTKELINFFDEIIGIP